MAKGNFIEFVVSDNPNRYPNDGEQGGYYWELYDGSGQYAWKKYSGSRVSKTGTVTITLDTGVISDGYWNCSLSTTNGIDTNSLSTSDFYNRTISGTRVLNNHPVEITLLSNGYWSYRVNNNNLAINGNSVHEGNTWNFSNGVLHIKHYNIGSEECVEPYTCSFNKTVMVSEYSFENFVVSDNASSYPNKAVHTDGYYYEKIN